MKYRLRPRKISGEVPINLSLPSTVTFTSAQIYGTSVLEYNEEIGETHYQTNFSFKYNVKGSFWINSIQYTFVQTNWNNYWDEMYPNGDGNYSASGNAWYWSTSQSSHQSYFTIHLKKGGTIQSSNSLYFSGNPISSVSVSGGNRGIPNTNSNKVQKQPSNNLNCYKVDVVKDRSE